MTGTRSASLLLALGLALWGQPASAFSQLFVLGDSLSDTGNTVSSFAAFPGGVCASPAGFPSPPYVDGACTNGPTWVEHLATGLGTLAEPGTSGGTNFAVGGATAATDIIIPFLEPDGDSEDISDQLGRLQAAFPVADPNALYVIVAGANDLQLSARAAASTVDVAQNAVDAIMAAALQLSAMGAQHFLFANVFDLGVIPDASAGYNKPLATALTADFNTRIATAVAGFAGGSAALLDMNGIFQDMLDNPGSYGLTNTTDACVSSGAFGATQDVNTACIVGGLDDQWFFFDEIHPNQVGHAVLGAAALALVPEPTTLALFGVATVLAAARRKRR